MKRLVSALFGLALVSASASASAQVLASASQSGFSVDVGGIGSAFQPGYAGNGIPQTSPNRLYGPGAYIDARFTRWIQAEAEGRWLRFNEFQNIGENTYMIGPKVPVVDFHRWSPYGKFLIGWGSGTGWLTGRATVFAYGGGVDFRLSRRFTIRPFDFEKQEWRSSPSIWPYGASAGISYRILGGRAQ
ncbi:MAG TPA: outer membrane beta-barrel protein [Terracidiphilus sp.]|nr:outer membrane beta-barrel protein [Terracidiphilus sp.]